MAEFADERRRQDTFLARLRERKTASLPRQYGESRSARA
jgi:hypothetical protein